MYHFRSYDLTITILMHETLNKMKLKWNKLKQIHTTHTINKRSTLGKFKKNPARRWGTHYELWRWGTLLFSIMNCKYKKRGTHYRVVIDTMFNMDAIGFYTSSVMIQYPTLICFYQLGKIYNTIRMEVVRFLVA